MYPTKAEKNHFNASLRQEVSRFGWYGQLIVLFGLFLTPAWDYVQSY